MSQSFLVIKTYLYLLTFAFQMNTIKLEEIREEAGTERSTVMKKIFKLTALVISILSVLLLTSCEKMDKDYGKSDTKIASETAETGGETELIYPEIKSSDNVMPKYFDISRYDEENYADIYLGKKFKYNITYSGSVLTLPSTYSKVNKAGWKLSESGRYKIDSVVMAGSTLEVELYNEYDNRIVAVFHNSSKSSKKLTKCDIVKFVIPENCLNVTNSYYGQFWVNGITNQSAINNIVEHLGAPSHFYAVNSHHYYLDYFFTEDNKRSGITVHVDPENDILLSIEFADYG